MSTLQSVFFTTIRFDGTRNNKVVTYTLSVWDFAGQEDFYVSHQCFLSKKALYLVGRLISLASCI